MAPHWFELVAWAALAVGFASALVIGADIALLGNRQHMAIMNVVFPLTALYMGPVAVWAYFTRGRRMSHRQMHMHEAVMTNDLERRDSWWQVSLSDSHCGAGCVLGDICGEWLVWASGWMALAPYVLWDPPIDSSSHWFVMQIGMTLGFLTSWPVNRWLLTNGVKEPMMAAGRKPNFAPTVAA
jgi:Domain of unknown function (DUF4396)